MDNSGQECLSCSSEIINNNWLSNNKYCNNCIRKLQYIDVPDYIPVNLKNYYRWLVYNNTIKIDGGILDIRPDPDFLAEEYFDFNSCIYNDTKLYYHHNLILKALRDKAINGYVDVEECPSTRINEILHFINETDFSLLDILQYITKYYILKDNNKLKSLVNNRFSSSLDDHINNSIRNSLIRCIGYAHICPLGLKVMRDFIFTINKENIRCISIASGLSFVEFFLENIDFNGVALPISDMIQINNSDNSNNGKDKKIIIDCYDMRIGFNDDSLIKQNYWKYPIKEDVANDNRTDEINYDVLFLSWPPEGKDVAYNCVSRFTGDLVIYIGEYPYTSHELLNKPCTANDKFHQYLKDNFILYASYLDKKYTFNLIDTFCAINLFIRK